MEMKRLAMIAFTPKGEGLLNKISEGLPGYACQGYVFRRDFNDGAKLVSDIFYRCEGLVFICACGIAVRLIAPFVKDKTTDPGVVVVDEGGRFSISLLSGHLGGANELAGVVAEAIGGEPVITTATDISGRFSPDSFARANHLYIDDMDKAKHVAAAVLRDEEVGLYSEYSMEQLPAGLHLFSLPELRKKNGENTIGICISRNETFSPFSETLHLIPQNIILGLGCRKNTPPEVLEDVILAFLEQHSLSLKRIRRICSIDLKCEEQAILDFSHKYRIPFRTFTASELNQVEGRFSASEFVKKTTGVDNVCERSAMVYGGRLLVPKQAWQGVTLAASELDVYISNGRTGE